MDRSVDLSVRSALRDVVDPRREVVDGAVPGEGAATRMTRTAKGVGRPPADALSRISAERLAEIRHRLRTGAYSCRLILTDIALRMLERGDV